ncbi:TRAP transporter substrate-binding protein DctP [Aurantimonas sp. C2-6-R+9]|uniref:TRAP transporter substrate-binding protein n=1 Tax=unclassified Aurantimonas TaxID=2638230 RepID=UPI002E16C96E|nr:MULTISPECIES: TRAP transporter substrate-binding protein DctP [unclassified Aurantimonas]MEC5290627.1 TRAP transporter substrate-binding protein DctP [Aurantimonas sp. C2-3-R2]MEC5380659.1 TRAP transporter substrate-binding protein DctP [Aurantimonas sp. C2-6-R+9]MEC5411705.1 TRAP transporter substrate-binding protein DctP [Aurantimonas sp. C2-4-R8]
MIQNRRNFLMTAAAFGGAAVVGFTSRPARAGTTMTGVYYIPQSYRALSYGPNGFVERLNASDAVDVEYYDSGRLVKADEQLPALRAGSIDFMFHTTSYINRSIPILGAVGLPSVAGELYANPSRLAKGSPLFELINEELAKDDLYMVSMMGNILEPEYIWSTKDAPIRSIDDLKGKKVSVVSYEATKVIESFGAAAVRIPSSELYLALQRRTVDAAVVNPSTVIGRSLEPLLDIVYKLPINGYGIALFVDRRKWEVMDKTVKAAVEEAAAWLDENGAAHANDKIYPEEYWPTIIEAGTEVVEPPEDELTRLEQAAETVIAEWKAGVGEGAGARAIALATGAGG